MARGHTGIDRTQTRRVENDHLVTLCRIVRRDKSEITPVNDCGYLESSADIDGEYAGARLIQWNLHTITGLPQSRRSDRQCYAAGSEFRRKLSIDLRRRCTEKRKRNL